MQQPDPSILDIKRGVVADMDALEAKGRQALFDLRMAQLDAAAQIRQRCGQTAHLFGRAGPACVFCGEPFSAQSVRSGEPT